MSYFSKKNSGFSLIEVMLAVLVLSIGILAVSKLQTSLLRSGADANNRAKAAAIAERKIDDLRRFIGITEPTPGSWSAALTSPTDVFFDQIITDEGGLIGPGAFADDPEFSISWTVNDYYYPTALSTPQPTTAGIKADFKRVSVTVDWVDVGNTTQNITLDTIIASYPPVLTAQSANISAGPREGPKGLYTPLQAPDVVPVRITGDGVLKETSKPRPEVTKQDYATVVDFETVTYIPIDNGKFQALRRENFSTVACSCSTNRNVSPDVDHIYGYTTWDPTAEQYVDYTDKVTNGNNDQEDFAGSADIVECGLCCKDGQYTDDPASVINGQVFGFNGVDQTTNGTIDKVCRLKTIDGIRRVIKPWKLIGFNVIPASYFDDGFSSNATTNISSYSNYVTSLVRYTLGVVTSDNSLSVVNVDNAFKTYSGSGIDINSFYDTDYEHTIINTTTAPRTIQARAIYMDYPPEGVFNNPTTTNYTAANVPLDRIPFFEINMTGLVGWAPDEDNSSLSTATVPYTEEHDEALQGNNVIDPCQVSTNCISNQQLINKTFGEYERGVFYPKVAAASVSTEARIYRSTDGVVDANVNSNTSIDSSVDIQVN